MSVKSWRKALNLILVLGFVVGVAACGNRTGDIEKNEQGQTTAWWFELTVKDGYPNGTLAYAQTDSSGIPLNQNNGGSGTGTNTGYNPYNNGNPYGNPNGGYNNYYPGQNFMYPSGTIQDRYAGQEKTYRVRLVALGGVSADRPNGTIRFWLCPDGQPFCPSNQATRDFGLISVREWNVRI
jgi:hypothetical protein